MYSIRCIAEFLLIKHNNIRGGMTFLKNSRRNVTTCHLIADDETTVVIFIFLNEGRKEGNILFNDALNTFLFTVIRRQTYG